MPSPSIIVGRSPADDDPVVRDGEIVRVPLLLRDGSTVDLGGGLMMADGTSLEHRLRFASPQVRTALGLPAFHVEDGRGGVAGHRPGFAFSRSSWPIVSSARPRSAPAGVRGLSEAADRGLEESVTTAREVDSSSCCWRPVRKGPGRYGPATGSHEDTCRSSAASSGRGRFPRPAR